MCGYGAGMSEEDRRQGLTIGRPEFVVRGRVFGSLLPGEISVLLVYGGIIPVPTEIVDENARMPNTLVWVDLNGEHRGALRVWRRNETE